MDPPENLLGANMPLQLHALGAIVADVTAHPNREVGVTLGMDEAAEWGPLEMEVMGPASGEEGDGGWLYGL